MDAKPKSTPILRRAIPLYLAIPLILATCICGYALGRPNASPSPSDQDNRPTDPPIATSSTSQAVPTTPAPPTVTRTNTPTRTPTGTATLTQTPIPPPTQTALAVALAKTQAAMQATATRQALNAERTAVAQATSARATLVAQYSSIDYRELVNYADSHVGEKVWIRGRVFNINSTTELQMYFAGTYDAAYIVMADPFSGIYENDVITVYGEVLGENCGTNAFGAEICQPLLIDAFYTK